MSDGHEETTESGQPIYRHKPREQGFELATGNTESIVKLENHIEAYVGKIDLVYHEIISDLVHIDVHRINPRPGRDYYTLITTGMSDRPMTVPPGQEDHRHAEMMICLPPGWKLSEEDLKDERNYWPIRLLKLLSRFPHEYDTWLGVGHTVPNGDPPEPYAPGVNFCCALILIGDTTDEAFDEVEVEPGKVVRFLTIFPITRAEMDLKLKKGIEGLLPRFAKHGVSEVVDIGRKDAGKRSFWPL